MKNFLLILVVVVFNLTSCFSQTPGLIYKPAGNALGKSVLDPNGDGFTSPTLSGFSGTDYGTGSELNMTTLPVLIDEPLGDLTTGSAGGHTEIVTNGTGAKQSCYVLTRNVGGVDYLIVRFRLGGNSTSPKAYSLLFDTDNNIANNYNSSNPGFEKEVVLSASNNVSIYSHNASGATLVQNYNVDNYQQRSVAISTASGNADYFYDFFVPLAAINATGTVRLAAITVNSLQSGLSGTVSDINGVNDTAYGGNYNTMFQALIAAFPPTPLTSLTTGFSFPNSISTTPVITGVLNTSSTSISGTSQEANGAVITVYKNGISIGTTTVTTNAWTLTGVSGLVAGNLITAKATATGKTISAVSNSVEVAAVQLCFTPAPTNLVRTNGQIITGNYAHTSGGAIVANTVRIRLYEQVNATTYTEIAPSSTIYVASNGTWSFPTGLGQSVFNTTTFIATATFSGCISGYSVINKKTSGQVGTITATPTMVTTQIIASPSIARSVQVTNNDATASKLILYINGYQVAISPTTITSGASYTFSYTGFIESDIVTARAQSATIDYWLSNPTTPVNVIASIVQTTAPVITGTYIAGTGKTVTGTSTEIPGTVITLYKAGTTLLGTTTVNSFGNWSVAGLTLLTGDVITAYAKATSKTLSAVSNSVTVAASMPLAPTITGTIVAGQTTISGLGGLGTITVYVDGSIVGTTTGVTWTLSGINPFYIYRGGVVTATNTVSGITSLVSNAVTIQGVVSFCITNTTGGAISPILSEVPFSIKITAMDGPNCTGSVFTGYTGTVTISSSTNIISGGGTTANFVNGVLTTTLALGNPGTGITITAVNPNDPTAIGTTSLNVIAITATTSSNQTLCPGTPSTLTLTTNLSTISKWQKAADALFTSPTDIAYTTTTLTGASIGVLTSTTYFRAVLLTGSNSTVYSTTSIITILPASIAGTVSSNQTICINSAPSNITLTGSAGAIQWQSSIDNSTFTNISGATSTVLAGVQTGNLSAITYFRAVVTNGSCTPVTSGVVTIGMGNTTTWNGTSWDNGVPTTLSSVLITGNFTSTASINACSMTVSNNAIVTIVSGHNVSLYGSLTVNSGSSFTLNNNSNLLQTTTVANTGNIIIKRNTPNLMRLDYVMWSSPVDGQMLQSFSPMTLSNRFYTYNSSTNLYVADATPATTPFTTGIGYLIRMPNTHPATTPTLFTGTFTGTPHNGTVNLGVSSGLYTAVGNPYPSAIDADDFIASNGITEALYFWRKTNNTNNPSYATYTTAGGVSNSGGDPLLLAPNGVLQVGQGFIVKPTSNTITFSNAFRRGNTVAPLLRIAIDNTLTPKSRYWLNLTSTTGNFCQTMVAYLNNATTGVDAAIDGKFFNDSQTALTSIINNEEYAIQGRGLSQLSTDIVPLGFKAQLAGEYTIGLDHFDGQFAQGQSLFLKDNLLNTLYDLKLGGYTFVSESGVYNSRYEIVYQNPTALSQVAFTENAVVVYKQNQDIVIQTGTIAMASVHLYDISGRLLVSKKHIDATEVRIPTGTTNQVLIVKITSTTHETITKKIVN